MRFVFLVYTLSVSLLVGSRECFSQNFLKARGDKQGEEDLHILILGNSITKHSPSPQLGWTGNWGMAASKECNDYVHVLINTSKNQGYRIDFDYFNVPYEREFWHIDTMYYSKFKHLNPEIIILQFGENVSDSLNTVYNYSRMLSDFGRYLCKSPSTTVILLSSFWTRASINEAVKAVAEKNRWLYIPIDDLSMDESNTSFGLYADRGVGSHPSDKGMEKIATRIWVSIKAILENKI